MRPLIHSSSPQPCKAGVKSRKTEANRQRTSVQAYTTVPYRPGVPKQVCVVVGVGGLLTHIKQTSKLIMEGSILVMEQRTSIYLTKLWKIKYWLASSRLWFKIEPFHLSTLVSKVWSLTRCGSLRTVGCQPQCFSFLVKKERQASLIF